MHVAFSKHKTSVFEKTCAFRRKTLVTGNLPRKDCRHARGMIADMIRTPGDGRAHKRQEGPAASRRKPFAQETDMNRSTTLAISALALALTLSACGGGDDNNDDSTAASSSSAASSTGGAKSSTSSSASSTSSSAASSSSSSSSSSVPPAPPAATCSTSGNTTATTSCWYETFSAPDRATFSTTYATTPLPPVNGATLYLEKSGMSNATFNSTTMTLTNGRFLVGADGSADSTASSQGPNGIFNLNGKTCTLAINATAATGNIQVYVNNSTTSVANSPVTGNKVVDAALTVGDNSFTFGPLTTSGSDYLQIRAASATNVTLNTIQMTCN